MPYIHPFAQDLSPSHVFSIYQHCHPFSTVKVMEVDEPCHLKFKFTSILPDLSIVSHGSQAPSPQTNQVIQALSSCETPQMQPLTEIWEVWVLLLLGKLRGLSSCVEHNVGILLSRILESQTVGKSVENCVEILLVQGSFAKEKQ
jgi:hypothetical protein